MNFAQKEIKRINRNRMIIHGISAAFFLLMILAVAGSGKSFSMFLMNSTFLILITATFIFFFIMAARSHKSYMKSNAYKRLEQLGYASAEMANQAISEDIEKHLVYSDKSIIFTENWIIVKYVFHMNILRTPDLIWMYKQINSVNGIRTYFVMLSFANQKQLGVSMKNEAKAGQLISFVSEKYPNILTGYSRSLYKMFKNNFNEFLKIAKPETNAKMDG